MLTVTIKYQVSDMSVQVGQKAPGFKMQGIFKPRIRPPKGEKFLMLRRALLENDLNTVCEGARCPNVGECWSRGTATFMILGTVCTRNCRFCAVEKGKNGEPPDPSEPARIADAVKRTGLRYVVLTSVDRDDLPDGGAGHFADCVRAIKSLDNNIIVETLIPDFKGDVISLERVVEACPDVVGHNIETTEEFQAVVRDKRAGYSISLDVLQNLKQLSSSICTKSSLMLGLGETEEMVLKTMRDLSDAKVDIITLGQYLRPSPGQLEVREYLPPDKFEYYRKKAIDLGFLHVVSGPLVRSSYLADTFIPEKMISISSVEACKW